MEEKITSKEELIRLGEPFKKLHEVKGFCELPEFRDMLIPLKDLITTDGFEDLNKHDYSIK